MARRNGADRALSGTGPRSWARALLLAGAVIVAGSGCGHAAAIAPPSAAALADSTPPARAGADEAPDETAAAPDSTLRWTFDTDG